MIGNNIKELRNELKMNQTEFGESVNVSQSDISSIEAGKSNPSKKLINAICNTYPRVIRTYLETGKGPRLRME
jgi:DNA-binding XRE family transcriptional regulator